MPRRAPALDVPDLAGGNCAEADPEEWFPEKGGSSADAIRICHRCPILDECLAYALASDERFGIWGGTTPTERKRLIKQRRALTPVS